MAERGALLSHGATLSRASQSIAGFMPRAW